MLAPNTTLMRINSVAVLAVLCILLVTALNGYFRADDFAQLRVTKFEVVDNPASIVTGAGYGGHYRPVVKAFFWINYLLFGLNPLGYFIIIIGIFLLTQFLLFRLAQTLSNSTTAAYAAVFLFLLQGNTYLYTVNWIGAVTNVLAGFFIVSTLLFYVKSTRAGNRRTLYYLLALVSFGLGLLSREVVITLITVFLAYDILFLRPEDSSTRKLIGERWFSHFLFWLILAGYILARDMISAPGAVAGIGLYTFRLASNVLKNAGFYGGHLGFLPLGVFLLAILAVRRGNLQLERRDLKLIALGSFLTLNLVLPLLFFGWNSPTWMYPAAFGTALACAPLLERGISGSAGRARNLLLHGTLICALAGNLLLFVALDQARWWQWGAYSRNVLNQVTSSHPSFPPGVTLYFIDQNELQPYGLSRLFRSFLDDALQIWYEDPSLQAYIVGEASSIQARLDDDENSETATFFVFAYDEGQISDQTESFRTLSEAK